MQTVTLKKWGNSIGVRYPKRILDDLNVTEGDILVFQKDADGRYYMTPERKTFPQSLDEVFARASKKGHHKIVDFGASIGAEVLSPEDESVFLVHKK